MKERGVFNQALTKIFLFSLCPFFIVGEGFAKDPSLGRLIFLGKTANSARSVWLSLNNSAGAFELQTQGQQVVDAWTRPDAGRQLSLSPFVSNGSGGTHFLMDVSGNKPVQIDSQNQKGGFTFPPNLQIPPSLPPFLKPPSGLMPSKPGGNRPKPPLGTLPPSGITPELPMGVKPPIGSLPPGGLMPNKPGGGRPQPPVGTLPPSGLMPTRPGGGRPRPPVGALPPSGITPDLPMGVRPPVGTLPPSGLMPTRPGGGRPQPPVGALPPSGITPEMPMGVRPPVGTLPPGGLMPKRPGFGRPKPPMAVLPPGGITPELPAGVQPPVGSLPIDRGGNSGQAVSPVPPSGSLPIEGLASQGLPPSGFQSHVADTRGYEFALETYWNLWTDTRFYSTTDRREGLDLDGSGHTVTVGADRMLNDRMVLGLMISAEEYNSDSFDDRVRAESHGFTVGPYLSYQLSPEWVLEGSVGYGSSENENEFFVLDSEYTTERYTGSLSATGQYAVGPVNVRPRASISHTHFESEAYGLTGSIGRFPIDLPRGEDAFDSGVAEMTVEFNHILQTSGGTAFMPYLEFGASYEFERPGDGRILTGNFTSTTTTPWCGSVRAGARALVSPSLFLEASAGYLSVGQDDLDQWEGRFFISHSF